MLSVVFEDDAGNQHTSRLSRLNFKNGCVIVRWFSSNWERIPFDFVGECPESVYVAMLESLRSGKYLDLAIDIPLRVFSTQFKCDLRSARLINMPAISPHNLRK